MAIEQIMYFALGFLIATLLAIVVMPSIWKRAVRLTKKRIEATTPITMSEFRAEKDQLRAQFALTSRRLERSVETLRTRLTEQLSDLNTARSELALARAERDQHKTAYAELDEKYGAATARIEVLEEEIAALAERLRHRDSEITDLTVLASQAQPANDTRPKGTKSAIASIKQALSFSDKETFDTLDGITEAYSRISSAGSQLSALLEDEEHSQADKNQQSLADKLSQDEALEDLHRRIGEVETTIREDWQDGKADKNRLRDQLGEIASKVSQVIYATDDEQASAAEESLFDRISRFAGDSLDPDGDNKAKSARRSRALKPATGPTVSDRITAFRDIHANN